MQCMRYVLRTALQAIFHPSGLFSSADCRIYLRLPPNTQSRPILCGHSKCNRLHRMQYMYMQNAGHHLIALYSDFRYRIGICVVRTRCPAAGWLFGECSDALSHWVCNVIRDYQLVEIRYHMQWINYLLCGQPGWQCRESTQIYLELTVLFR